MPFSFSFIYLFFYHEKSNLSIQVSNFLNLNYICAQTNDGILLDFISTKFASI